MFKHFLYKVGESMETKIIDRYVATPIGVAKYNTKTKRYYIRFRGKFMTLYKALFLSQFTRKEQRQFRNLEVHHIDGDRFNNELENLVCISHDDHVWIHGIVEKKSYNIRVIENTKYDAKMRRKKNA